MKKIFKIAIIILCAISLVLVVFARVRNGERVGSPSSVEMKDEPAQTAAPVQTEAPSEPLGVVISEVMSSNKSTLADANGEFPDWIELHNTSNKTADLSGAAIECSGSAWTFPKDCKLMGGGYMLLLCGSTDTDILSTDFTLDKLGSTLKILRADGVCEHEITVPSLAGDESYVMDENGAGTVMLWPTPGYENTPEGIDGFQSGSVNNSPLQIWEVMTSNSSYSYFSGKYTDWVELKNISSSALKLSDYYLSDSGSQRNAFKLPDVTLEAGHTTLIYCDAGVEAANCAPFGLSADDDQLFLSYKDGTLVDYVHLHDIDANTSVGRRDGENGFFYFDTPTPDAANTGKGFRAIAERPVLLSQDGVFNDVEEAVCELTGKGKLYYTLDGSTPTERSTPYTEPIRITETCVVRAVSVQEGLKNSPAVSATYIMNENHTLPIVSISGDESQVMAVYNNPYNDNAEGVCNVTYYEDGREFSLDCGFKLHGDTSKKAQEKRSIKLKFKSKYDGVLDYDMFGNGVTQYSSLLVRAAQEDAFSTLIRDNVLHEASAQCFPELPSQDYKYCILYINGHYWGVYTIREAHSEEHYANHYGYDPATCIQWKETWPAESVMAPVMNKIMSGNLSDDSVYNEVAEHLNIESFVGWACMRAYAGDYDCYPNNVRYYYSSEDGKMSIALVDLDLTFYVYDAFDTPMSTDFNFSTVLKSLMNNGSFRQVLIEKLSEALKTGLSNESMHAAIDRHADIIRSEIERDRERWGGSVENWENMIQSLHDFVDHSEGRAKMVAASARNKTGISDATFNQYFGFLY